MSGPSLKSLIPPLARVLGLTPAALYERQRALVRAGLLHPETGRGPGSGVRATADSVAMWLVALLATGSLSETEERTRVLANLRSQTKACPLTGKKTFAGAVAELLRSEDMANRILWIEAVRSGAKAKAVIVFSKDDEAVESNFGPKAETTSSALSVNAHLFWPSIAHFLVKTLKAGNKPVRRRSAKAVT